MADKKFADYVKDLMESIPKVNGNPMMSVTSMTDENARYREDPFYISRDAQERKRLAEEEAAKQAAQSGSGLFGAMPEGGGVDGGGVQLTKEQLDFLERETPDERANRIKNDWFGLKPIGATMFGGISGLSSYLNQQVPTYNDLLYQQAVYNKTPSFLQKMLPDSYQKAAERANEYASIMGGISPYEEITPTFTSDWSPSTGGSDWSPSERTQEQMDYTRSIGDFSV